MSTVGLKSLSSEYGLVCKQVIESVSDAIACMAIHANESNILAYQLSSSSLDPEMLQSVADCATQVFSGYQSAHNLIDEILVSYPKALHFYKIVRSKQLILVLMINPTASQGIAWASLRSASSRLLRKHGRP